MDTIHKTNKLGWLLYILMVRDDCGSWLPTCHFLTEKFDSDIMALALTTFKRWYNKQWRLRYMLIDDSAVKQRAIRLSFRGLKYGEIEVGHLLCRVYCERTIRKKLAGDALKDTC